MAKAEYRSAIRSRKLINKALADLLQEKPLDKITVTDVVNRANINRGTFYAHYADIPDVIEHLVDQSFCRFRDALTGQSNSLEEIPGMIVRLPALFPERADRPGGKAAHQCYDGNRPQMKRTGSALRQSRFFR